MTADKTATAFYSYTIDDGEVMTTTETTITFTRTVLSALGGPGAPQRSQTARTQAIALYSVEIATWNCTMTTPVTDTEWVHMVSPPPVVSPVYLPFVPRE